MRPTIRAFALGSVLVTPLASAVERASAQSAPTAISPSTYLDVLRAGTDLRQATAEFARAAALRSRAMLSPSEYDERRAAWERARLTYLGTLAAAGGARTHVAIVRAVKVRRPDGRLRVELALRNDARLPTIAGLWQQSDTPADDPSVRDLTFTNADDDRAALVAWTTAHAAVVALKTESGANGVAISRPYERTLPDLAPGQGATVEFDLLEDLSDIVVSLDAAGRTDERRIRLEVASSERGITVDAAQSSLEGDLGTQIVYDLHLRRARPSAAPLRLDVRELPAEIAFEFREAVGGKRLRQLRFADGATAGGVQLVLSLPDRPSNAVPVERALAFSVVAEDASDGPIAHTSATSRGVARLELVPRGVARLEMRPATLTLTTALGRSSVLPVTIRNAGSGRVEDVRLRVEPPSRWHITSAPGVVPRLAPGEEARVELRVQAPPDATVGDYELRLGIDDAGSARRVEVDDKLVRLHVVGRGGWLTPVLLALAAAGLTIALFTHGRRWINR